MNAPLSFFKFFLCLFVLSASLIHAETELDIIDCHTHFYDPSRPEGVPWPGKKSSLYRTVLPKHLKELKQYKKVAGTVIVEASSWVEDNAWLLELAKNDPFIVGIVGRLEPGSEDFAENLKRFSKNELYRGIRVSSKKVLHCLNNNLLKDFEALAKADLTLDVNGGPDTIDIVAKLAQKVPQLRIIINHIGNVEVNSNPPPSAWQTSLLNTAKFPNVAIKISALAEGASRGNNKAPLDLNFYRPYIDSVWKAFGEDRVIYGSNWPVSERAMTYEQLQKIITDYVAEKGTEATKKFFSLNAKKFYKWVEREGRLKKQQQFITYEDHIKPIFRQHCLKCHGEDKQKADLNLQTFVDLMKGSSGGDVVIAGRSSKSLLYESITTTDEGARMPPKKPAIPMAQINLIKEWIDTGLRNTKDDSSLLKERNIKFNPSVTVGHKPKDPAMPLNLPKIKIPETNLPLPILSMDASPWAPLLAVSAQEHIRLIHTDTEKDLGHLPFPEGVPHVVRFSRDGSVLMAAGGQAVKSGKVVLFDVKSGKRLTAIGDEIDAVLAADLSPNQKLVALGGSGKMVKVYSTENGRLKYKLEGHTDWITSLAFSPDGKTLASTDRQGALKLWDAESGGLLLNLAEHKASIISMDWRSDSKLLATIGEDGLIVWWDVSDGWPVITRGNAHPIPLPKGSYRKLPNGVLSLDFAANGSLLTTGRNKEITLWDTKGNKIWSKKGISKGLPIESVVLSKDKEKVMIMGDSHGQLKFWKANI